jgi:hypothetical protein
MQKHNQHSLPAPSKYTTPRLLLRVEFMAQFTALEGHDDVVGRLTNGKRDFGAIDIHGSHFSNF